ncbi:MAG: transglycosylase SLT domain-containing protein, partial [Nitrospinota bacterium]
MVGTKDVSERASDPFHIPEGLKNSVGFWMDVYAKYSTNEVIFHDSKYLDIVFEVITIPGKRDITGTSYKKKSVRKKEESVKNRYKEILRSIHLKKLKKRKLSKEEERVATLYKNVRGAKKFLAASKRIRSQVGMRERFEEGVKRSGLYLKKMKEVFKAYGLPEELAVLPHVESSFNYKAYSSVGAAGIWQFMRNTGRMYLKINYEVDERLDPIVSTRAAAKLLKRNFNELGNWPMAIIAYNHGLGGMKRAKRKFGEDVVVVINRYKSRLFGFASRNFYSEFLAALTITRRISHYFADTRLESPFLFETLPLKSFVSVETLSKYLNINKEVLKHFNPALRPPVLKSEKLVPKGYVLNLPKTQAGGNDYGVMLASIPKRMLKSRQIRSDWYRVQPGDSLSTLSRKFKTTISSLMAMNNVRNAGKIYAGQIFKIPGQKKETKRENRKETEKLTVKVAAIAKKTAQEAAKLLLTPSISFSPAIANAEGVGRLDVTVAPEETLGHYSEWSGVHIKTLRKANGISGKRTLVIGEKITIPNPVVTGERFEKKR